MTVKLFALHERLAYPSTGSVAHPHEGKSFHIKGKDLPTQYHGGPVTVRVVNPAKLQLRDKGTHGKGMYTTSSRDLASGYAQNHLRKDIKGGVISVKKAHPDANILVAGEHEHTSHPDIVNAVKEFSPKYAKTGDVGMGDMTWRNQVNRFADHHKYDAVQFKGQDGQVADHVLWKNHDKLLHATRIKIKKVTEGDDQQGWRKPKWLKNSGEHGIFHHNEYTPPVEKHELTGKELGTIHHGTPHKDMREVDPSKLGHRDAGYFGKGFYGSTDPHTARMYKTDDVSSYGHPTSRGKLVKKELVPTAKVLRYHRVLSKNQPHFIDKVMNHNLERRHMDAQEVEDTLDSDQHTSAPTQWDHAVKHYADHHQYDAVHVIQSPHVGDGRDEVRVRNVEAIKGPEQQKKLPVLKHLYNFNKGVKREKVATSPSGKVYRKK